MLSRFHRLLLCLAALPHLKTRRLVCTSLISSSSVPTLTATAALHATPDHVPYATLSCILAPLRLPAPPSRVRLQTVSSFLRVVISLPILVSDYKTAVVNAKAATAEESDWVSLSLQIGILPPLDSDAACVSRDDPAIGPSPEFPPPFGAALFRRGHRRSRE